VRILLDECLPKRLKRDLVGHEAQTVPEMGWASRRNGELLALAEARFDVFLTVDRNLSFQQDIARFKVAVVVLVAKGNRYPDLRPLVPDLLAVLAGVAPGQLVRVGA
jgi:predicted nuclease of predicted toxin-antitoxin system